MCYRPDGLGRLAPMLGRTAAILFISIGFVAHAEPDTPHAVFLIHEVEYETARTLPTFAREELERKRDWTCTFLIGNAPNKLPDLEALESADLLVVSMRRQVLPREQLDRIKAYCESGKAIVGLRTASHAFALRRSRPDAGAEWPEFDAEILGGNYTGHHPKDSPPVSYRRIEKAANHPILKGISSGSHPTSSWLYNVSPLAKTAVPLMMGQVQGDAKLEPVAWTNVGIFGNRVFYTSLGHPDDFESEVFHRLLLNGILWAVESD